MRWWWRRRRMGRRRRRSRGMGGRRRRRCGPGRRWRRPGRSRRRCGLRLGLAVGTQLFLGLRDHHRRGLRVRRRDGEMHGRKRGGGKQCETKSCHDGWGPRSESWPNLGNGNNAGEYTNMRWAGLWRPAKADLFLFPVADRLIARSFIAHSVDGFKPNFYIVPCGIFAMPGARSGPEPGTSAFCASVAGCGPPGSCGPRTGNSSGV
jgi:hypothetical protein